MSGARTTVPAREVRIGDRVFAGDAELTVTRIDTNLLGIDGLLAFVEDSEAQWLKVSAAVDGEVEVERPVTPAG